jgi:phosphohistidine phosphatase
MERLILLRHGKAEANAPSGKDFDRSLTERGRSDSLATARALVQAGFVPDMALVSTAVRARQTWDAASAAFPGVEAVFVRELYNAAPEALLAEAHARGHDVGAVLVVAHNPGLHQLAVTLGQGWPDAPDWVRLHAGFPTGAAAAFDLTAGRFVLLTPKGLGGGA